MVDLCQEATQTTGPVSLFIGIESAKWTDQQFIDAAKFCKAHGITCIFLKCFEVGSQAGDIWYGGLSGVDIVIGDIKSVGIQCIPYGFLYGDDYGNLAKEIDVAKQLLSKYGVLCLDMEGQPWASADAPNWAKQIATALEPIPGELWVSCPANPVESGHLPFLQAMLPATNVFMPMVYSDYLATRWEGDFKQVGATCVQPTIDLSGEFGPNDVPAIVAQIIESGAKAFSIWEYQFAQQFLGAFDSAIALLTGNQPQPIGGNVQLNSQGCVCDVVESYQLETGESQDLCGPWSVAALKYAGQPGKGATGTPEQIDQDADKEADKWLAGGHVAALGSTIENMHAFLHDNGLHYWDMSNPTVDDIRKAVQAGYPVLITVNEQNIKEKRTGKQPPYPWNLNANHILPITGIDKDGDFISPDSLNNKFQGYWPVVYVASVLNPSWATAVQLVGPDASNPWLKPIPSGNPTDSIWHNFNAQNFGGSVQPQSQPQGETAMQKQFDDVWSASPFVPTGYKSGIYQDMLAAFQAKKIGACFPTSDEIDTTDWGNNPIKFQPMSNGLHAEWAAGKTKVYDALGHEII